MNYFTIIFLVNDMRKISYILEKDRIINSKMYNRIRSINELLIL